MRRMRISSVDICTSWSDIDFIRSSPLQHFAKQPQISFDLISANKLSQIAWTSLHERSPAPCVGPDPTKPAPDKSPALATRQSDQPHSWTSWSHDMCFSYRPRY